MREERKRRGVTLVVATAALVVGFGGAEVAHALTDNGIPTPTRALSAHPRSETVKAPEFPDLSKYAVPGATAAPDGEAPGPPAATGAGAVIDFLRAEVAGDFDSSFQFLSASDRAVYPTRARWAQAHGELERITDFTAGAVRSNALTVEVDAQLTFHPTLDEVVGLVPAAADSTWTAVPEDGGWRVDYADLELQPQYPDSADAPAAVRAWIRDRAGCSTRARADLFGSPVALDSLCTTKGRVEVGGAEPLAPGRATDPFLAAYGTEVFDWALAVQVESPVAVHVVVAPIGTHWRVIGVIQL